MTSPTLIIQRPAFNILIVIDTIEIKKRYPNPNNNFLDHIRVDQANWFAIYPCKYNLEQTTSLHFVSLRVKKDDKIIISGISIDGGSSDGIIINKIQNHNSKKELCNPFEPVCLSRKTVFNNLNNDGELSLINVNQNLIWFESTVFDFVKSKVNILFSLYNLSNDGNQQNLFGSYWFPIDINIYKQI